MPVFVSPYLSVTRNITMRDILQRFRILPAILLASLAACSNLPPGPAHTAAAGWSPPLLVTSQVEELMQYYDYLRKQPAAELVKEYDKARQNLAQSRTDVNRVRVAMLLALPNAPFHDTAAALGLLNEVVKETKTASHGVRGLASMMAMLIAEQQELSQKLKDEQKRADALQGQVDGIKNMEKNLIRRDRHGINAKP